MICVPIPEFSDRRLGFQPDTLDMDELFLRQRPMNIYQSCCAFYDLQARGIDVSLTIPDREIKELIKRIPFTHQKSGFSLLDYSLRNKSYEFSILVLDDERAGFFINYVNSLQVGCMGPLNFLVSSSREYITLNDFEQLDLAKKMLSLGADLFSIDREGRNLLEQHIFSVDESFLNECINLPLIRLLSSHGVGTSALEKNECISPKIGQAIEAGKTLKQDRIRVINDQLASSGVIQEISKVVSDYLYAPAAPTPLALMLESQARNNIQIPIIPPQIEAPMNIQV